MSQSQNCQEGMINKREVTGCKGQMWHFFPSAFKNLLYAPRLYRLAELGNFSFVYESVTVFLVLKNLYSHLWANLHATNGQYKLGSLKLY